MTGERNRLEAFANPFFVLLKLASVMFVLTVFAYLVSPYILAPRGGQPARGAGSFALAAWLDRNAPVTLGAEFAVMLAAGVLAMATDHWFSPRARARRRD
jgi:hypothetical protein